MLSKCLRVLGSLSLGYPSRFALFASVGLSFTLRFHSRLVAACLVTVAHLLSRALIQNGRPDALVTFDTVRGGCITSQLDDGGVLHELERVVRVAGTHPPNVERNGTG